VAEEAKKFNPNDDKHLVNLKGRQFITFVGLQARLMDQGKAIVGSDIDVLCVPSEENGNYAAVKATLRIKGKDGEVYTFTNVGDASPQSVGKNIVPHVLRQAETRAEARALRLATRSEWTAKDEVE
jgi:hypothetical protein